MIAPVRKAPLDEGSGTRENLGLGTPSPDPSAPSASLLLPDLTNAAPDDERFLFLLIIIENTPLFN